MLSVRFRDSSVVFFFQRCPCNISIRSIKRRPCSRALGRQVLADCCYFNCLFRTVFNWFLFYNWIRTVWTLPSWILSEWNQCKNLWTLSWFQSVNQQPRCCLNGWMHQWWWVLHYVSFFFFLRFPQRSLVYLLYFGCSNYFLQQCWL